MNTSHILKSLSFLIFFIFLITSARASDDPCVGLSVTCGLDSCMVCWKDNDPESKFTCEDVTKSEVLTSLPGCVDAKRPLGLTGKISKPNLKFRSKVMQRKYKN